MARRVSGLATFLGRVASRLEGPPPLDVQRAMPWFRDRGDETLKFDYDLSSDSVVFDLGGYEGDWTAEISARYGSQVHVFEPVPAYYERLSSRFAGNKAIHTYPFGLADADKVVEVSLEGLASSAYRGAQDTVAVELREADAFLRQQAVDGVHLMTINIEGGEYDLLDHLLATGWVPRIRDLQVQFHDVFPDAEARMKRIQASLSETHYLTFQYPFVWENWRAR
jgi:FkbM family methyltransferase